MGIDGIQGGSDRLKVELKTGQNSVADSRKTASPAEGQDQVQLSDHIQEFLRIRKLVDGAPDVRADRVEQLRQKIGLGSYNVPSSDIASAMLRSPLIDAADL
jgi:flagellar biosynthesis anti-sigma factor FlgM